MPSRAVPSAANCCIWFSWLAPAYRMAISRRIPSRLRSSSLRAGCSITAVTVWVNGRPSGPVMLATGSRPRDSRSAETCTLVVPSATPVTIFSDVHSREAQSAASSDQSLLGLNRPAPAPLLAYLRAGGCWRRWSGLWDGAQRTPGRPHTVVVQEFDLRRQVGVAVPGIGPDRRERVPLAVQQGAVAPQHGLLNLAGPEQDRGDLGLHAVTGGRYRTAEVQTGIASHLPQHGGQAQNSTAGTEAPGPGHEDAPARYADGRGERVAARHGHAERRKQPFIHFQEAIFGLRQVGRGMKVHQHRPRAVHRG